MFVAVNIACNCLLS